HHREDVDAARRRVRLLELLRAHHAHNRLVAELAPELARLNERVPLHKPLSELALCLANAAAEIVVKFDGEIDYALRGEICGHIDLAPTHDAEVDHALPRGRIERRVSRCESVGFEGGEEFAPWFLGVDPAEKAPDRTKIIDVVDQRSS